ncbi:MAG: alpha/beta hydrolase, partial [Cyanobacteria bacterium J06649_11]
SQHLENCKFHCYPNTAHLFPWEIPHQLLNDIDSWLKDNPQTVKF